MKAWKAWSAEWNLSNSEKNAQNAKTAARGPMESMGEVFDEEIPF